ncbi:hypothetical protein [Yimella lutea]|uniref:hypothetical protein n=1 Tax=Yimella lutea TaxID=587872 RepID=UPI00114E4C2B|nr:hypothetical protein [Yimella lutea]
MSSDLDRVGQWTGGLDKAQTKRALTGEDPFDETTMLDDDHHGHAYDGGHHDEPRKQAQHV